ncbi:MAG: hypothetical protein QGG25_04475 [Phycisphaerae bacterium]|nr:hypothetical protein [Phycisphaerae bacterium]
MIVGTMMFFVGRDLNALCGAIFAVGGLLAMALGSAIGYLSRIGMLMLDQRRKK